jgi:hypothetical protein
MPATLSERLPLFVSGAWAGAGAAATSGEVFPIGFPHAGQKAAFSAIWVPHDAQSMTFSLGERDKRCLIRRRTNAIWLSGTPRHGVGITVPMLMKQN